MFNLQYVHFTTTHTLCYTNIMQNVEFGTLAIWKTYNLQHMHFVTLALFKKKDLHNMHFATHALCNTCTLQCTHFATHALCNVFTLLVHFVRNKANKGPKGVSLEGRQN